MACAWLPWSDEAWASLILRAGSFVWSDLPWSRILIASVMETGLSRILRRKSLRVTSIRFTGAEPVPIARALVSVSDKTGAVEFARFGITANAILPGWIESEMTGKTFADAKFAANVLPRVPMRRWGKPADFGGIAVYFASDASAFHTADSALIDGGYWVF